MGREIRRVPPNWEHPRDKQGRYLPLHDITHEEAMAKWTAQEELWNLGHHPSLLQHPEARGYSYEEWSDQRPNPQYHRPAFQEEPTWYQVYENVTEGTPVTPPMPSLEDLEEHLVSSGTTTREQAQAFIQEGNSKTFLLQHGTIHSGFAVAQESQRLNPCR